MPLLNEIERKRAALRKTEVREREGKLGELIVEGDADYNRLMRETYFEEYYNLIERFTFKSVMLPLTLEEIKGEVRFKLWWPSSLEIA